MESETLRVVLQESSQGTDGAGDNMAWQSTNNQDLINYLNKLPPQVRSIIYSY